MRQWDRFLDKAERAGKPQVVREIHEQRARRFTTLAGLAGVEPLPGRHYVLNLDRSPDRLRAFHRMGCAAGFRPVRHAGVDAAAPDFDIEAHFHDFPEGGRRNAARRKAGGFACFVGHRAIWHRARDENRGAAVIYEDDAMPLADPLRYLARYPAPEGWDVIKFSERVEPLGPVDTPYLPVRDALLSHFRYSLDLDYRHPPGNDGYIVSPRGLQRLPEVLAAVGLPASLDYTIVRNGLVEDLASPDADLNGFYNGRQPHRTYKAPGRPLEIYVTSAALSELSPVPSVLSPIRHANREEARQKSAKAMQ